jgi:dTMP kinase
MSGKRGKLIVIEGTDGSGKETQTRRLLDRLISNEISCETICFPQYDSPTGKVVAHYLGKNGQEFMFGVPPDVVDPMVSSLLYAADRKLSLPRIERWISDGRNVIVDRWTPSNEGHQGGKIRNENERSDFYDRIETLEYEVLGLPRADIGIFLYMSLDVALDLRAGRAEEADGHEADVRHLERAEKAYLELAKRYGWDRIDCAPDGTRGSLRSIDDIAGEVYCIVENKL